MLDTTGNATPRRPVRADQSGRRPAAKPYRATSTSRLWHRGYGRYPTIPKWPRDRAPPDFRIVQELEQQLLSASAATPLVWFSDTGMTYTRYVRMIVWVKFVSALYRPLLRVADDTGALGPFCAYGEALILRMLDVVVFSSRHCVLPLEYGHRELLHLRHPASSIDPNTGLATLLPQRRRALSYPNARVLTCTLSTRAGQADCPSRFGQRRSERILSHWHARALRQLPGSHASRAHKQHHFGV